MGNFKKVHRDPYEDAVDLGNHKSLKDKVWVMEGGYYQATSVSFSTDGRGIHRVCIHISGSLPLLSLDNAKDNVVRLGGMLQAQLPRPFLLEGRPFVGRVPNLYMDHLGDYTFDIILNEQL